MKVSIGDVAQTYGAKGYVDVTTESTDWAPVKIIYQGEDGKYIVRQYSIKSLSNE